MICLIKVKTNVAKVENKVEIIEKKFNKNLVQVKGEIKTINKKAARNEESITFLEENFEGLRSEVDHKIATASSNLRNQ